MEDLVDPQERFMELTKILHSYTGVDDSAFFGALRLSDRLTIALLIFGSCYQVGGGTELYIYNYLPAFSMHWDELLASAINLNSSSDFDNSSFKQLMHGQKINVIHITEASFKDYLDKLQAMMTKFMTELDIRRKIALIDEI